MVRSRQEFIKTIINIIKNEENFILPIIGEIGTGKTHLFWALKNKLYLQNTIYISLENVYRKFYYNLYSEYIEEMGSNIEELRSAEILRNITKQLCNEWGALEKRFGFFHLIHIEKVRKVALEKWSNKFEDKVALRDAINAISTHQLDPYKKIEAERWLLGELMDSRELSYLGLSSDLKHESHSFLMLKILIENSKSENVLFIDDFEKIISLMKPDREFIEIFEPSWLYGNEKSSPDYIAAQKTLEKILKLQKIKGLRIIITLKSIDSLEEIKKIVKKKNKKLLLNFKKPLFISNFAESDIYQFYKKNIEQFLKTINYFEYLDEFPDAYFPINKKVLKYIFNRTQGNPREITKFLIKIFNEIIYSDTKVENIIEKYENIR